MELKKSSIIKDQITIWRLGLLPGFVVILLTIIARLSGSLQFLEWITLDHLLRLRPAEARDERVVIIGINEDDIKSVGHYPIPDKEMALLLRILQESKPRVIGLDITRNIPVEPGHSELVDILKGNKNIIGIEKVLLPDPIDPPPGLPPEQVGFSDVIPDQDGKYRRSLLGTFNPRNANDYKFSLSLRLAQAYLSHKNISLENAISDPQGIRFGSTEIPRFLPNTGGYVRADAGGTQVLLNFRNGQERFRTLSLNDIKTGKFNSEWIRDRIVIIGMTASSVPDPIATSAIGGLKLHGEIYGSEFHAHSVSQIIGAVLDRRPLLQTGSQGCEYIWIFCWGVLGFGLGGLSKSTLKKLIDFGATIFCFIGIGYILLLYGWWIPVAPVLLVLVINYGVGLSAFAFYQYDKALKTEISVRQSVITTAFTQIHNGPLQTLAILLRDVQTQELSQEQLSSRLQTLNLDIRNVEEQIIQEALNEEEILCLGSGLKIDLKRPIHELFYEVYSNTIERRQTFPYFRTLKVKIRDFEPIEEDLSTEEKRQICRFLEEALCNVGKHAKGLTRLSATGRKKDGWYTLSIKDNGSGVTSSYESKGTKDGKNLAKELGGHFKRESLSHKETGTLCELTWLLASGNSILSKIKTKLKSFSQNKLNF